MLILSFDTSGPRLAAALAEDAALLAAATFTDEETHMRQLLPAIEKIMAAGGRRLQETDLFAAVTGPGSFTGIRIGVATAQALAAALHKRCLPLNSLEAAAYDERRPGRITAAMFEARNRRVYAAAWRGRELLIKPSVGPVTDLARRLRDLTAESEAEELLFCGDETAARYAQDEEIVHLLGREAAVSPERYYRPEVLAKLASEAWQAGRAVEPQELLPEYYAATQAERNFGLAPEEASFG